MIGVNPPGNFLWNAKTTDEQIRKYSALCSKDATCSRRTDDLAATIKATAAHIPDHWLFLPIKQGNVRIASFYGLMESTSEAAPISGPMTIDSLLSAAQGDASGLWLQSLLADFAFPKSFVWGQMAAAAQARRRRRGAYFASRHDARLDPRQSRHRLHLGRGQRWPRRGRRAPDENEFDHVRRSSVETLLIGGALDFATPPQIATKELLPYLPNGHQVVLAGVGHTTPLLDRAAEAGSRLINAFYDSGRVDESLTSRSASTSHPR